MQDSTSARPDAEGVPVERQTCTVGCLGDCDHLTILHGDRDARARWHERAVAFLASPAMTELAWFLRTLAERHETGGEREPAVHLVDFDQFISQHNWPDPMLVDAVRADLMFLAMQRVEWAAENGRCA